ncbi:DNA mismatch repair protein mlh3, putative [Ixodes scapularis]|uniref:DNA mismatch repair protein mlh3, putative n=1 Tax=Ixodes scapularis TaxID=6945 RepID=B7PAH6_IXOSC|nr:DNA mismatch repair protein mlh3, putative [Ixodes scapularis]|eukprot:XP_002406860.1 DNA mismatch repair protein mlh3, putative [Ixodes scapularis]
MYAGNWMAWVDVTSGQTMYINVTSGNSAFAPLPCFKEDHQDQYKDKQGSCLKSSSLKPPLSIALDPDVARRAAVCEKELRKLGVHFGAIGQQGLVLERLPSCLVERDDSERRCGRPSTIATQAQELLREHTEVLLSTRRSAISLPKVLLDVLSSQACRGAIKFGSVLDLSECRKILAALSRCSLPFQCAHGRPSLSPVVDLRFLPPDKAPNRPNLAKLPGRIAAPASQVQVP